MKGSLGSFSLFGSRRGQCPHGICQIAVAGFGDALRPFAAALRVVRTFAIGGHAESFLRAWGFPGWTPSYRVHSAIMSARAAMGVGSCGQAGDHLRGRLWVRLLSFAFLSLRSRMKALVYHGSKDVRVETAKDHVSRKPTTSSCALPPQRSAVQISISTARCPD